MSSPDPASLRECIDGEAFMVRMALSSGGADEMIGTTRRDFIKERMETIHCHILALSGQVGPDAAMQYIVEIMQRHSLAKREG